MRITVLGASGTYGAPDEPCSGFLVRSDATCLLVDAGPGTIGELQRHMPLTDLDAVVVSHSHPDHWVEVPTLVNALRYVLDGAGLPLFTTAETLAMIRSVVHRALEPTVRPEVIDASSVVPVGDLTVSCSRTDHPPETLAFCIDDGRHRVAYSADTGPGWSASDFGAPVDLLICEATFRDGDPQGDPPVHMTAAEAGAMAAASGARRLVLTHLLPGADSESARREAEATYGAPVGLAARGVELSP